jgi:cell division protein FtsB
MDYMSNAATSAEQREYAKTLKTYRLANETEALRAENAKLKAEVARLRKASGHEAPKGSSRRARG